MIDLKLSKSDKKKKYEPKNIGIGDGENYPWGFTLNVEKPQIKKLGLDNFKGGDMVEINAIAKITLVRTEDTGKSDDYQSMSIQIQKIEFMTMDDANKKMRKAVAKEVFDG